MKCEVPRAEMWVGDLPSPPEIWQAIGPAWWEEVLPLQLFFPFSHFWIVKAHSWPRHWPEEQWEMGLSCRNVGDTLCLDCRRGPDKIGVVMQARMCSVFKSLTKTIDTVYIPGGYNWLSYFSTASFLFTSDAQCSIGLSRFRGPFLSELILIERWIWILVFFLIVLKFLLFSCKQTTLSTIYCI